MGHAGFGSKQTHVGLWMRGGGGGGPDVACRIKKIRRCDAMSHVNVARKIALSPVTSQKYPCRMSLMILALMSHCLKEHSYTHTCTVCVNGFTAISDLMRHSYTHTGEKPHTCKVCAKGFSQSASLKEHPYTHTGEKPHTCKVCAKGFSQSASLKDRQHRIGADLRYFRLPLNYSLLSKIKL